jgi:hypothetical protein
VATLPLPNALPIPLSTGEDHPAARSKAAPTAGRITMITGTTKALVDSVWNTMWTGGISNPQTVMEQLTLLLFLRGLDDAQTRAERQAQASGTEVKRIFPEGRDAIWSAPLRVDTITRRF